MSAVLSPPAGLHADFTQRVVVSPDATRWTTTPVAGVSRLRLDRIGDEVARATSFVRFAPGSRFTPHVHDGGEEILVLSGVFSDEFGDYPAGSYLRNPPGSRHAPWSTGGCTLFIKLRQFQPGDLSRRVIDTRGTAWRRGGSDQASVMPLHEHGSVRTRLIHWRPGIGGAPIQHVGGAECVVLDGDFSDENGNYPTGTWIRMPRASWHRPRAGRQGVLMWLSTGHLETSELAEQSPETGSLA